MTLFLILILSGLVLMAFDPRLPVPREAPGVSMPEGDAARGIPGPTGALDAAIFRARREKILAEMAGGVALMFSRPRIGEGERQDLDFQYLTGLEDEAGAALLLSPEQPVWKEMLFLAPVDPEVNRWDGERAMLSRAVELATGAARVLRTGKLSMFLSQWVAQAKSREMVFLGPIVGHDSPVPAVLEVYQKVAARVPGARIRPADEILPRMRQVKEPGELALMRKAIEATGAGLLAAMRQLRAGMKEADLKDVIETQFRAHGCRRTAFASIVGSGPNAAILHYRQESRTLREGELVLCDVGAEYESYAADVTRTFPVSGKFTSRQREVYEVVLKAHQAAAAATRPGAMLREDIHQAAVDVIEKAGFVDAFIHGTGHFLGLDVHDAGLAHKPLVPGSVITIEPGIYLPQEGIGIRIEDDVLVTQSGNEVLTASIPRSAAEIEAAMAQR